MTNYSSLYGSYRSNKFSDIFENAEVFKDDYLSSGICIMANSLKQPLDNDFIVAQYYLLSARYANSIVASSDPQRFKENLFSLIWQYGLPWKSKIEIQDKLRNLSEAELLQGNMSINNSAQNPSTEPSTSDDLELSFINAQTVSKNKKSKLAAYATLYELIKTDVTELYLSKFKKLFLTVVEPEEPLLYEEI